eukprot:313895-Rhodomonas_salina.1
MQREKSEKSGKRTAAAAFAAVAAALFTFAATLRAANSVSQNPKCEDKTLPTHKVPVGVDAENGLQPERKQNQHGQQEEVKQHNPDMEAQLTAIADMLKVPEAYKSVRLIFASLVAIAPQLSSQMQGQMGELATALYKNYTLFQDVFSQLEAIVQDTRANEDMLRSISIIRSNIDNILFGKSKTDVLKWIELPDVLQNNNTTDS